MAQFKNVIITAAGQSLISKVLTGSSSIEFTKFGLSETEYTDEEIEALTSVDTINQTAKVSRVEKTSSSAVKVAGAVNNNDLKTGYYVNTMILFAKDSADNTEVPYAACGAEIKGWMAPFNGLSTGGANMSMTITVQNADKVDLTVDPAGVASISDLNELRDTLTAHSEGIIASEAGVHGLRYYDDALQVKGSSGEWQDASAGGGIAPNDVSGLKIKVGNEKLTVYWSDPKDTVVDGQALVAWAGTKLVMKEGAYPTSWKDGTQLVDNKTRGAYSKSGYEISNLTNGTTYYFQLFPYSDQKAYNNNAANRVSASPQPYKTLTVKLDLSESDPKSCVSVADDLIGMTQDEIKAWFGHYPVLFVNGKEAGKLNPNNFAQFENGSAADITTAGNDVMIAFPRRGLSITRAGQVITIKFTDDPDNADFKYYAHQRGTTNKDVFYLGAYKGYVANGKLYSSPGKTITANQTIGTFRTYAQARGTGYDQSGFYQLVYRQAMYVAIFQTLDSQSAVGQGYVASGHSAAIATGGSEAYGMDSEIIKASNPTYMTDQQHHVKCLGLEDFWGNIWEWIDGLVTDSSRSILTATDGFNDAGTGYTNNGVGASADIGNYMSDCQGTTETGFIAKTVSGSTSTYFCDCAYLYAGCVAAFGGSWADAANAGAFHLDVDGAASVSNAAIASRLMYL